MRLVGVVVSFEKYEEYGRVSIHCNPPFFSTLYLAQSNDIAGTVDDGSGKTMQLVYFKENPNRLNTGRFARPAGAQDINFRGIELDSVVKAKGEITEFRGNRQLTLRKIGTCWFELRKLLSVGQWLTGSCAELVTDTNAEVQAWRLANDFKRDNLLKPWVISKDELEGLKRRAAKRAAEKEKLGRIAEETETLNESSMHQDPGVEMEEKPKVFYGKRREKKVKIEDIQPGEDNQAVKVKREREMSMEPPSTSQKRIKREPAIDTVADRKMIQQRLDKMENEHITAAKAGKKIIYATETRHKVRIKQETPDLDEKPFASSSKSTRSHSKHNSLRAGVESRIRDRARPSKENERSKLVASSSATSRTASRTHRIRSERSESTAPLLPPPPPAPPDPEIYTHRSLKLVILSHIQTAPMPNFTISSLRLVPEIEMYIAKVVAAQNPQLSSSTKATKTTSLSALIFKTYCDVLQTLVQDGNLIRVPPHSSHAYIAVGKWNLGDLIEEAIATAKSQAVRKLKQMERITEEEEGVQVWRRPVYGAIARPTGRIAVRSIWLKAQARGGGWQGVTKGVVAEVVREVLEEEGGWKDVGKGIWEWEIQELGWEYAI